MVPKSRRGVLFAFEEEVEEYEQSIQGVDHENTRRRMFNEGDLSAEEYFFLCGVDDANGE
ncbi:MAG: hypothetical protein ACE5DM_04370 [Candidatus Nanoarchaeia archaeon]